MRHSRLKRLAPFNGYWHSRHFKTSSYRRDVCFHRSGERNTSGRIDGDIHKLPHTQSQRPYSLGRQHNVSIFLEWHLSHIGTPFSPYCTAVWGFCDLTILLSKNLGSAGTLCRFWNSMEHPI